MNFDELQRDVYAAVRDTSRAFIEETDVQNWLNDAYIDMVTRLRFCQTEITDTFDGTHNTIALPDGTTPQQTPNPACVRVESLRIDGVDARFVNDDVWNSWSDQALTPPYYLARTFAGNVELYPTPAAVDWVMRYSYRPARMGAPDDVPLLEEQLHPRLVAYARAQALYKEGDYNGGDRYLAMFAAGLPGPETGTHKKIPGPMVMAQDPGPFE